MNYLDLYGVVSLSFLLLFLLIPVSLLVSTNDPVACLARAIDDLTLSVAKFRPPVEIQQRGDVVVVVLRWPDLGPLANSLLLPLVVSSIVTLLGLAYGLLVYLYRVPRFSTVLPLLAYLPIPFVKVVALHSLLDPDIGLLNRALFYFNIAVRVEGLAAVALYQVLALFPFSYSLIVSYALMLPRELTESAYSLGSGPRSTATGVLVPLLKPATLTSLALTYVFSLEDLEAPLIFEGYPDVRGLLSYRAYVYFISEVYSGFSRRAIGYAILLLVVAVAVFTASARYLVAVYRSFGAALARPRRIYRNSPGTPAMLALVLMFLAAATAAAPTLVSLAYALVDPVTLRLSPSIHLLLDPTRVRASVNTVVYTATSLLYGLALALPLAYRASRKLSFYKFVEALAVAPLAIPGVAVAYSYVGLFGSLPVNPYNTPWFFLVLSYTLRRLPYVYVVLRSSMSSIPRDYEESAQAIGAGPARAVATAVAPLAISTSTPGLALAALAIATEVSTSITIGGLGPTQGWGSTAPLIYVVYRDITTGSVSMIGTYSIAILLTAIASIVSIKLALDLVSKLSS